MRNISARCRWKNCRRCCCPSRAQRGSTPTPAKMLAITPLIRERIRTLREVATTADFFFAEELPPYDTTELIPQKGDARMALAVLEKAARDS